MLILVLHNNHVVKCIILHHTACARTFPSRITTPSGQLCDKCLLNTFEVASAQVKCLSLQMSHIAPACNSPLRICASCGESIYFLNFRSCECDNHACFPLAMSNSIFMWFSSLLCTSCGKSMQHISIWIFMRGDQE